MKNKYQGKKADGSTGDVGITTNEKTKIKYDSEDKKIIEVQKTEVESD